MPTHAHNTNNHSIENESENESESESENENENENENKNKNVIKELNHNLDKIIDKTKSFEEHIKLLRKIKNLEMYYYTKDYDDKELAFKVFKLKLAHLANIIDEELFAKIFGFTLEALVNKLINTTNKEENQIIVENIKENKEKLYEVDETSPFNDYVIQPSDKRINLKDVVDLVLDFNKEMI